MFRKILIANRGEIAVRIIRTCREMGIPTVAVYSDVDRKGLHVRMADEAVHIGDAAATASYLDIERVLDATCSVGADAIHPGYGFLSENAAFARACASAAVKFIGPSPESMELMGSKTRARQIAKRAGVPVIPATTTPVDSVATALSAAEKIGFPVMLKAVAGGGGKGMRMVSASSELPSVFRQAQGEAEGAFGDCDVYIEKAIANPRHVEVQILADEQGQTIHLGERECSLQRRYQKVLEESPSPLVAEHPGVREKITRAAVQTAKAANYTNAGTVEFLMDAAYNFYFLEMNARLQVEHPVTECVTGIDLVKEQIRIAAGEKLRHQQDEVSLRGSAIECRIYAEDPNRQFLPSPGRITALSRPSGPGVRVDSGAYQGWTVPVEYDPLIAKLIVWAASRGEAIRRLRGALAEYHVGGIKTTVGFFRDVLLDEDFGAGRIDTGFIERWLERRSAAISQSAGENEQVAMFTAAVHSARQSRRQALNPSANGSAWKILGRRSMLR